MSGIQSQAIPGDKDIFLCACRNQFVVQQSTGMRNMRHNYPALYPWFNLLTTQGSTGIRETRNNQGEPFNLRQAEIIIGQGVTNAVNGIMDVAQAVNYINRRIQQETGA
ncbi:hypothetical protein C7M51_01064 [Mixta intestinalis]|uniref:Uncharacterized protein n=2 Tax=Mixta intestinalis TaxID=1615494 RepID=A0A6P1PYK2_9GAMM|nr:hypothetical protein C7M51_01064 [Mixta intestinalis]